VAAVSYVAATLVGVVMRFELVGAGVGAPFDHLLHAHSHTLYFGWAALGALAGGMPTFPRVTPTLGRTAIGLVVGVPLLFVGFLVVGYSPVTIAVSTLVMVGWYLAAASWWRQTAGLDRTATVAFRGGLVYLVASSLGVWVLAALRAGGGGTTLQEGLAVHAFLVGFGWFFVFAVVGLLVQHAERLGLRLDVASVQRSLRWWLGLAWITFPLGVDGGPEVGGLGSAARLAGILLIVPGARWVWTMWRGAMPGPTRALHRLAAMWFGLATVGAAGAAVFGTPALVAAGRQGIVIHLHALFVGYVTSSLVLVLTDAAPNRALRLHHIGLSVMLVALALVPLSDPEPGLWMAAAGATVLWLAGVGWARAITVRR
jgi:hypothetical protein